MSSDLDRRIGAAVRRIADEVPVAVPEPPPLPPRGADRTRRAWWGPALVGAAVIAVLAAVALVPVDGRPPHPRPGAAPAAPVVPRHLAGMSLLTASVSAAPPGPVVALYRQGSLGTTLGTSQLVVLGADGRTYRRLDVAERDGNTGPDGEWSAGETLLSPDGRTALVANADVVRDRYTVVDLTTGRATRHRLDPPRTLDPVTWSADGTLVLVRTGAYPLDGSVDAGSLGLLDVAAGTITPLPGGHTGWFAALSPDGSLVAVEQDEGRAVIVDRSGAVRRTLPKLRASTLSHGSTVTLTGGAAWSPDGRLLAFMAGEDGGCELDARPADGGAALPPVTLRGYGSCGFVGWRSADTVLVEADGNGTRLLEVPLRGGPPREISSAADGVGGLGRVYAMQVASGLAGQFQVRDAGGVDRGPWPRWWRTLVTAAVLIAAWLLYRRLRGSHRRILPRPRR